MKSKSRTKDSDSDVSRGSSETDSDFESESSVSYDDEEAMKSDAEVRGNLTHCVFGVINEIAAIDCNVLVAGELVLCLLQLVLLIMLRF